MLVCWTQTAIAVESVVIETLLLEARGEGLEGMQAVAEVIRKRSKESGTSYVDVVMKPWQFSCWNEPSYKSDKRLAKFDGEDWQLASQAWEQSETSNLTGGANHYLNTKAVKYLPRWAKVGRLVGRIGKHTFYIV